MLAIPGTFSRGVAADVTLHRSIRTSKRLCVSLSVCLYVSVSVCVSLSVFVSVSVSLSLSDEPSHESRNASTSKQNCTNSTLPAAEEAQHQVAPQLWIPALSSMCLLVQSAVLVPAGSSMVRQHAGCTVRLPPPLQPNHAATWCTRCPIFHKSRSPVCIPPLLCRGQGAIGPLSSTYESPHSQQLSLLRKLRVWHFAHCHSGWR